MKTLGALRKIRDVHRDDVTSLESVLLRIALEATKSARVTLRRGADEAIIVNGEELHDHTVRLELRFPSKDHETTLAFERTSPWTEEHTTVAEIVGGEIVVRLDLEKERRRARDLELVNVIGELVTRKLDLAAVLDTAVKELARALDVPRASVMLADADRKVLEVAASTNTHDHTMTVAIDGRFSSAHAFRTCAPVVVEDAAADVRASPTFMKTFGTRALLAVPLLSGGTAIGVIVLGDNKVRRFTKDEIARATAVASLVSPAIANAKMFEDLRRSYEALARAQADLVTHERLAALGELSAVIAHEVRNPLAVIFNSLNALQRLAPSTPDAKLLLDIITEEAGRLNRIVADLLDFVRPYSSHPRPAHVETLVRGAIDGARRALGGATTITADLALADDEMVLDGTMIQQALTNLIVNALQATGPDGTVIVRACAEVDPPRLRFEIVDEGPGIDDDDAAKIFQPFFTTKATGTGLGLAVVRRIADALGGTVAVTRGVARGSVFTLTVPANERA